MRWTVRVSRMGPRTPASCTPQQSDQVTLRRQSFRFCAVREPHCAPTLEALPHRDLVGKVRPDVSDREEGPPGEQALLLPGWLCGERVCSVLAEFQSRSCELQGTSGFSNWHGVGVEASIHLDKNQFQIIPEMLHYWLPPGILVASTIFHQICDSFNYRYTVILHIIKKKHFRLNHIISAIVTYMEGGNRQHRTDKTQSPGASS